MRLPDLFMSKSFLITYCIHSFQTVSKKKLYNDHQQIQRIILNHFEKEELKKQRFLDFKREKYNYNNKMSLNTHRDKDTKSVAKLTTYSCTHNDSFQNDQSYEEQFTLMAKHLKQPTKNRQACLAMKIALSFPPRIRDEVVKMVNYYEDVIQNQTNDFHKLVEENNKLKKENDKLNAQILINQLNQNMKASLQTKRPAIQPLKPINSNTAVKKSEKTPLKQITESRNIPPAKNSTPSIAQKKQIRNKQINLKGRSQNMQRRNV